MTIETKYIALSGLLSRLCLLYKGPHPLQSDNALSELIDCTALKGHDILMRGVVPRDKSIITRSQALKGWHTITKGTSLNDKGVALLKGINACNPALKGHDILRRGVVPCDKSIITRSQALKGRNKMIVYSFAKK